MAPDVHLSHVRPRERLLEVTLRHAGGARFTAEARQHRVLLDQPAEDGATDHGMSPAEMLLASLGGCIGQYVAQYLQLRGLSGDGLLVRVNARPTSRPLNLKDFQIEVIVPALSERQLRALEKSFPAGLVQNAIALENKLRITAVSTHVEDVQR
jgi:putative redox protein